MNIAKKRNIFIDKTARKPSGKWALKNYNAPKAHYRSFRVILKELNLRADDIYCEVGCGGGILLNMAMEKARYGTAVDHSNDMVQLAIKNNDDLVKKGAVEIIQGSAEDLPWDTDRFTACASANMFFFVEKQEAMLREVHRILKPGGRFSMVTMGNGILGKITFGWLYSLKTFSDKEITAMLKEAGFTNIKVKTGFPGLMQVCYGEKSS